MDYINFIGKTYDSIKDSFEFQKYFSEMKLKDGIDSWIISNRMMGLDMTISLDMVCESIHLFAGGGGDFSKFEGELPRGLNFSLSKTQIRQILGEPANSGGNEESFLYDLTPQWESFEFSDYILHIQYGRDENRIDLITIMSKSWFNQ